jgi:hypothetical protein
MQAHMVGFRRYAPTQFVVACLAIAKQIKLLYPK